MIGALFRTVLLWMMLMSLLSLVKSKETENYLNYLPFIQSDSSHKAAFDHATLFHSRTSPLQRFQFLFQYELRADHSRLRSLEEAIQYIDGIMGRSSKERKSLNQSEDSEMRSGNTYHQCNITNIDGNKPPFFGTVFYGGGLMSQFQSLSKSVMYGLHETHYSAPVIPIGVLHGYSTTQACDFADRSLYCYFQYLSPCQQGFHTSDLSYSSLIEHSSANITQSGSHPPTDDAEDFHSENVTSDNVEQHQRRKLHLDEIPILQSARYRHKPFHKEMIPKRFRQEGEIFWWGAMQYYIFLSLHPKLFEQYILQDALQETPSFMEHYLPFRPGATASTSKGTPHVSRSRSGGTSGNNVPTSSSGLRSNNRHDSSHSDIVQKSFGGKTRTNAHLYHRHERGNSNPSFSFSPVSSLDTNNPLRNLLATDDPSKNVPNSNNIRYRVPPKPRNRIYPGGVVPPKQIKTTSIRKASPHFVPTKSQLNNNMNAHQQQQQYLRGPNNNPQNPSPYPNPISHVHPVHNMDTSTDDIALPGVNPPPLHHPPMTNTKQQEGNYNLADGNHKMIQHNKPPRLPPSQAISSASSLAYSAQWEASFTGKTHRALSSLSILSLPRIGVHIRTRITPTLDTPEKRPHIPSSLQMNFTHFSLNDVNQHLRKTFQLCPIAMEIRTSHQPYIQCFLPIAFYPYSIATSERNNSTHNSTDSRSNTDSLHIWRLSEWLQAALQEKIHFIRREQLHVYTAKLSMHDSSTNKTADFTYGNNQQTFVNKNEIQEALSILKTICPSGNETAATAEGKKFDCSMPENHSVLMALNGTWLLPVDVFLATDDIQALQIARKRYHWVFFPPGISYVMNPEYTYKGTLFAPPPPPPPSTTSSSASNTSSSLGKKPPTIRRGHRNRQYHLQFKHIGAMLQSSTYVSYFASYQVQATLEILRDVFYLSHACRVLVGSVSSHVMRASVGMGYVTGSVQDVHWLEPEDKKRFWKDVFARTTMPIPELMQFP